VVEGVGDRIACAVAVIAAFAGQLIAGIVAKGGHGAIGIGPAGDIDAVVAVLNIREDRGTGVLGLNRSEILS